MLDEGGDQWVVPLCQLDELGKGVDHYHVDDEEAENAACDCWY